MIYKLSNELDIIKAFESINVDKVGAEIMSKKSKINLFMIKNLNIKAANILKQDALSVGADLATNKLTASLSIDFTDAILICSDKQLDILSKKELCQPFGLKQIGKTLGMHLRNKNYPKQIMGILNINNDSFFEQSRVSNDDFLRRAETMIYDGASIIDIGGVSSKPGSVYPGEAEEILRVRSILDIVKKTRLYEKARFSIDTFSAEVAKIAFDSGFDILNDITGLESDQLARVAGEYGVEVVIMHKKGSTKDMQDSPYYDDVMIEIDHFFKNRVEKAKSFGVNKIILDVGIGFGKTTEHNLTLIKHLSHFKHFGLPIMVGASRKKMLDEICQVEVCDRLAPTLAVHQKALDSGASIIRVHDVKEHAQMLKIWQKLYCFI